MNKENKAIIEMLLCAALWSIGGIFIKLVPWNAFAVAGMRSLVAGITIFVSMRIMGAKYVLNKKTVLAGMFSGFTYICFVCANKLTTAANAIVMQFTSPVFILLFSALLLGKKIRKQDIAVVLCTLVGIALCFFDQMSAKNLIGNVVGIATGMFMAGMYISVGELENEERFSGVLNGQIITFLVGLPFVIATKPAFTAAAVISVLILGVFQLGISYVLYVRSSRYCPPLACCLLGAGEPLLNPVWVMLFDGETPGILALIGGITVIISITLWCIFGKTEEAQS